MLQRKYVPYAEGSEYNNQCNIYLNVVVIIIIIDEKQIVDRECYYISIYSSKQVEGTSRSSLLLVAGFISFSLKLNLMQTTGVPVQSTRNVNFYP